MKNRYRRVPSECILSPEWDGLPPDARYVYLVCLVSPRQTAPGILDTSLRGLQFETGLSRKRLETALLALQTARIVQVLENGGIWIRNAFRWSSGNPDFVRSALRVVAHRWEEIYDDFIEDNRATLDYYNVDQDEGREYFKHGCHIVSPPSPDDEPSRS